MTKNLPTVLRVLFIAVIANYLAQIPYDLHLYGTNWNPRGIFLLGTTLLWFLVGSALLVSRRPLGYWLTVAFLAVQIVFYLNNEILLMFAGYGLPFHLSNFKDPIIWAVEFVGILNFIVAAYALFYLLRRRSLFLVPPPTYSGSTT